MGKSMGKDIGFAFYALFTANQATGEPVEKFSLMMDSYALLISRPQPKK